jgi:hypothetical protein
MLNRRAAEDVIAAVARLFVAAYDQPDADE